MFPLGSRGELELVGGRVERGDDSDGVLLPRKRDSLSLGVRTLLSTGES